MFPYAAGCQAVDVVRNYNSTRTSIILMKNALPFICRYILFVKRTELRHHVLCYVLYRILRVFSVSPYISFLFAFLMLHLGNLWLCTTDQEDEANV